MLIGLVLRAAGHVELVGVGDRPAKIRMPGVDLGIDDGDHHVVSYRDVMGFDQIQFAHGVLGGIAGRLRRRRARVFLQIEQIVWLRDADALGFEGSNDVFNLSSSTNSEVKQRAAYECQILRTDQGQTKPTGGGSERLPPDPSADTDDHFVGDEARLAARGYASKAGFAGKWTHGKPVSGETGRPGITPP